MKITKEYRSPSRHSSGHSPEELAKLASDPWETSARLMAARNPNTPASARFALAMDSSADVREALWNTELRRAAETYVRRVLANTPPHVLAGRSPDALEKIASNAFLELGDFLVRNACEITTEAIHIAVFHGWRLPDKIKERAHRLIETGLFNSPKEKSDGDRTYYGWIV